MPKHRVKHFLFCKQNAEKKLLRNLCSAIRLEKIALKAFENNSWFKSVGIFSLLETSSGVDKCFSAFLYFENFSTEVIFQAELKDRNRMLFFKAFLYRLAKRNQVSELIIIFFLKPPTNHHFLPLNRNWDAAHAYLKYWIRVP